MLVSGVQLSTEDGSRYYNWGLYVAGLYQKAYSGFLVDCEKGNVCGCTLSVARPEDYPEAVFLLH